MLAIAATLIVIAVLSVDIGGAAALRAVKQLFRRRTVVDGLPHGYDPGRELRAEQKARALLRSCVDESDWAMYAALGFVRVWGCDDGFGRGGRSYAYLIYPHEPIVCYVPSTGRLLNEYCVAFPDQTHPYGSSRLPASDDVLAKWMALTGDERRLIHAAEMHLPGRLVDPERVRRDLWQLDRWEQARVAAEQRASSLRAS